MGAYIVKKEVNNLDCVIISTGIDFTTTYLISEELRATGVDIRLVSMPSMDLFLSQPKEYQDAIIPPNAKVFTVEAGSTYMWNTFASRGCAIGIDQYGYSGDKEEVLSKLGFDYESIINKIKRELDNK